MAISPYIASPSILDVPEYVAKTLRIDFGASTTIKAGTPISDAGTAVNDGTAIGVLLYDVHKELRTVFGQVVISGRIKQDVAIEWSGIEVSAEAKAAMKNVAFTGDAGAGGGLPPVEGSGKALVSVNGEWVEQDGYGYTEKGEETLADETIETSEQSGMICGNFEESFAIEEDTQYTIYFNGDEYVLNSSYSEEYMMPVIGDFNDDENKFDFSRYPFGIGEFGDGLVLVTESAGTYDIAVSVEGGEVVHKIDEKYLPSGGGSFVWDMVAKFGVDETGANIVCDKTYEELHSAMLNSKSIFGIINVGELQITFEFPESSSDEQGNYILFSKTKAFFDDGSTTITITEVNFMVHEDNTVSFDMKDATIPYESD